MIQIDINVDIANSDIVFVVEVHGMNSTLAEGGMAGKVNLQNEEDEEDEEEEEEEEKKKNNKKVKKKKADGLVTRLRLF